MGKIIEEIEKNLGYRHRGYVLSPDRNTFYWSNGIWTIYATPLYECESGVPIEIHNEEKVEFINSYFDEKTPENFQEYLEIVDKYLI